MVFLFPIYWYLMRGHSCQKLALLFTYALSSHFDRAIAHASRKPKICVIVTNYLNAKL